MTGRRLRRGFAHGSLNCWGYGGVWGLLWHSSGALSAQPACGAAAVDQPARAFFSSAFTRSSVTEASSTAWAFFASSSWAFSAVT